MRGISVVVAMVTCASSALLAQAPTGRANPALASLDEAMTAFMQKHKAPGAALAVSKNGRLVYARGFGYADVEAKQPVQPASLFRIASISKPITAVAVLQLVERQKLKLDDKVLPLLKVEPFVPAGAQPDPRTAQLTVRQLLQHTSGWTDEELDPMFRPTMIADALGVPAPPEPRDIIRFVLGRPLDREPGEKYAYSNFNFCLLGRLIEDVTGTPYERYVQEQVLEPLGIRSMRIGRSLESQRAPGEVKYYEAQDRLTTGVVGVTAGKQVQRCYGGFYLEALDAHGGWIASAPHLVRFASAFDNLNKPRLLEAATVKQMLARPEAAAGQGATFYACGWQVRPLKNGTMNFWHGGRLRYSTCTLLVRRGDGVDYAVLFNTLSDEMRDEIDPMLYKAIDAIKVWPSIDLFPAVLEPAKSPTS